MADRDPYSGLQWVYVTRVEAHAHPKGTLGPVLWAMALFLILSGLAKTYAFTASGAPLWGILLAGILSILTGIGLILRMPWALIVAAASAAVTLYLTVIGMRTGASLPLLFDALVSLGILFHLMEGDRPNLIYRYRYRKYSEMRDDD